MFKNLFILFIFISFFIYSQQPVSQLSLEEINQEITNLKQALYGKQIIENHEEVQEQNYALADFEKFGKELQKIKKHEDQEMQLRERLNQLEKRRDQLLKND